MKNSKEIMKALGGDWTESLEMREKYFEQVWPERCVYFLVLKDGFESWRFMALAALDIDKGGNLGYFERINGEHLSRSNISMIEAKVLIKGLNKFE